MFKRCFTVLYVTMNILAKGNQNASPPRTVPDMEMAELSKYSVFFMHVEVTSMPTSTFCYMWPMFLTVRCLNDTDKGKVVKAMLSSGVVDLACIHIKDGPCDYRTKMRKAYDLSNIKEIDDKEANSGVSDDEVIQREEAKGVLRSSDSHGGH
ncbi:hypothetical protein CsSME_00019943 [Camellia sinensis var. sinensis]